MLKPRRFTPAILALALIVGGCSAVPQATSYPYSTQQKMQAMHHWEVLAGDVAARAAGQAGGGIFISPPLPESPGFQRAFHELLITHFLHQGVKVATEPSAQLPVFEYRVQTLQHLADRPRTGLPPLGFTLLAGGVAVARDAFLHGSLNRAVAGTILGTGVLMDAASAAQGATAHELMVTSSITRSGEYIFRSSDIYYIQGADTWHYEHPPEPPPVQRRVIEIKGENHD